MAYHPPGALKYVCIVTSPNPTPEMEEYVRLMLGRHWWMRCTNDWRVLTPGDELSCMIYAFCQRWGVPVEITPDALQRAHRIILITQDGDNFSLPAHIVQGKEVSVKQIH